MATGPDLHIDVPLSNLAVQAFSDGDADFIADQLIPRIPVAKQSDKYYTIPKGAFLRVPNTKRAPKTEANRVEFEVSSDSYFADNYALAGENAIEDIDNADNPIQLRQNTTRLVVSNLRRDHEVRVANLVTSISNVGSGVQLSGADLWSNGGSDPIADVTTAQAFIRQRTGIMPNTMVIDQDTVQVVRRHPLLLDMYKYTSGGQLSMDQLRDAFGIDRVLVGKGIKENALEGGTSSVTNIWGNSVLICHVGMATGLQSQTFALRFGWQPSNFPAPFAVQTNRENAAGQRHVEVLEAGYFQDEKIVATDLAYVIETTL